MPRDDIQEVQRALVTYARALDTRRWGLLDSVFAQGVYADYAGEVVCRGLVELKAMLEAVLGPCGPTQHLLGNFETTIEGDRAVTSCTVRAFHADAHPESERFYELFGEYRAELCLTQGSWHINDFRERCVFERGTYDVLGPYPPINPD